MYLALLSLLPLLAAAGPLEKRQGPSFTPNAPSDFCGAVFNTDACRKVGWSKVWGELTSHGVSNASQTHSYCIC